MPKLREHHYFPLPLSFLPPTSDHSNNDYHAYGVVHIRNCKECRDTLDSRQGGKAERMSAFQHSDGMLALLSELYEINERVMCGDIVSAKAAIASTRMKKCINHYHEAISEDGGTKVWLRVYVAAGGWVGITYSYELNGVTIEGSQTPRRI